uniref:Nucleolar protein 16 n=1 Tax=Alona affinis TaxID=381656 RepID=A0A9N6WPI1_9CRUS|nr:EOG090X0IKC [Alona affinis]
MVNNKKSRNRKKFQYHVNRKQVQKKFRKLPNINCQAIKKEWKGKLSAPVNMRNMGLVYDSNQSIPISDKAPLETGVQKAPNQQTTTTKVIEDLVKEANAPRNGTMKMPNEKVKWIEYLLDKYGEDYEAMAMDKNNHYQETAAQLRQKIKQFKMRPAYLVPFLRNRNILPSAILDQQES